jgi:Zn-dependent peptidase ImmA (M78 family)
MNRIKRRQINTLAEKIRKACELSLPVDVDEAIARLGGVLERVDDFEYEAKIEKYDEGFKITIVDTANEQRERFSVAHEVGHLFLHMGYLIDNEKWASVGTYRDSVYYRYGHSLEENEANEFAAAFLMPKEEFISVAQEYLNDGTYQISAIAKHFNVSNDAAANRGRWLGIFSWD